MEKQPLVVLTGPTAAGKTKLSIELARAINGEIISADSMQVYRHMDIGSAKIRPEEMEGIPHYLVDILEPTQDFNVVLFQKYAKDAMAQSRDWYMLTPSGQIRFRLNHCALYCPFPPE